MSLVDSGGLSAADVAAVMNGNNGGNGWGWGNDGGGWWFLIILFLFASGGWGNGMGGGGVAPFIGQQNEIQRGFDQAATTTAIGNLSTQVGQGFADAAVANCQGNAAITAAITGGQYATAQAITSAKDAITGTLNANQNANIQSQNSLAMALQQCCCENRAATADLKYTIAQENCADRQAISDGIRDLMAQNTANTNAIIQSQNQGFQGLQDKLCQLELDSYKQKVAGQAAEIAALKGAASQVAQTAAIIGNNEAQTANLLARLNPNPVPAYVVQNPNGCGAGYNTGCGCA